MCISVDGIRTKEGHTSASENHIKHEMPVLGASGCVDNGAAHLFIASIYGRPGLQWGVTGGACSG